MFAKTQNPYFSLANAVHWADCFPSLQWRSGLVVRSSTICFASEEYFSIALGQWHSFYGDRWRNHTLKHIHTTMIWLIWYDLNQKKEFICPEDYISINAHLVRGLNCWDLIRTRVGGSSDPLSNSLKTSHKWRFRCHKFTHCVSHKYRDLAESEAARSCLLLPTGWRAALNWRLCSTGEATHARDARQHPIFNPKPPQKSNHNLLEGVSTMDCRSQNLTSTKSEGVDGPRPWRRPSLSPWVPHGYVTYITCAKLTKRSRFWHRARASFQS